MIRNVTTAMFILGALACTTVPASADGYNWPRWGWHGWSASWCTLTLNSISQPNPGQPLHSAITNTSNTRLQYNIAFTVTRRGQPASSGNFYVDNANAGEQSAPTSREAVTGSLDNSTITLRVTSCTKRS